MDRVAVERADDLRRRLYPDVRSSKRVRVRVGIELSPRCEPRGIEGVVTEVSVTGAIIKVRDSLTKLVIDVPNEEIVHLEYI